MVCHSEGIGGGLTVADEIAVDRLFLRVQVVVQDFIEALEAYAFSFFLVVFANLRSAPNTLDHKGLFCLLFVHHAVNRSRARLNAR